MACIFYDAIINGDTKGSNNNYENGKIHEAITRVVKGNAKMFVYATTFFQESSNSAFRNKLFNLLGEQDKKKFQSAEELNNTAIANNVNINTIVKAVKEYAVETFGFSNVTNSKTNGQQLFGFDTISAKETAKKYTADIIKEKYYNALFKRKELTAKQKENANGVINNPNLAAAFACREIINQFYASAIVDEKIKEYNNGELYDKINKVLNTKLTKEEKSALEADIFNLLNKYYTEDNKTEVSTKLGQFYVLYNNVYNDLVQLTNKNNKNPEAKWIDEVCNLKSLSKIVEDIKIKSSVKEIEDYVQENDEEELAILEELGNEVATNTWDKIKIKASDYFKADIKLYFDTIYKSDKAYTKNINDIIPFSGNNELGVKETYGADFVIQQLIANAVENDAFSSPDEFLKMIENIASTNKDLYGFGKIANDMKSNSVFKHKIFSQIAKNPYTKVQIDIRDISSPNTRISNAEFFAQQKEIYKIRGAIKSTAATMYNADAAVKIKNRIDDLYNAKSSKAKNAALISIKNYIKNYVPILKDDTITNFLESVVDNINNKNILSNFIDDLNNYAEQLKKELNTANDNYNEKVSNYKKSNPFESISSSGIQKDYSSVNYDAINSKQGVINFAKAIASNNIKDIKLTSYNAENSMSSNIGDNNRLSWIVTQLNTINTDFKNKNDENAKIGLQNLLMRIKDVPQYKRSPFFFGIHNRYLNVNGLFYKKADGTYGISRDAQDLIRFHLFDGIKNHINDEGVLWKNMTRGDFYVSMLEMFNKPVNTYDYKNDDTYSVLNTRAGYFLPVPADMPKNAIMQYRKFSYTDLINNGTVDTTSELFIALRELVLGELQCMVDTAYALSIEHKGTGHNLSSYVINNNTDKKFKYYHYNGQMIDDNGKLTGNVFKFQRLFDIGKNDINEELINALSLYGGDNNSLFTYDKKSNSIVINDVNWVDYETHTINDEFVNSKINNIIGDWIINYIDYCNISSKEFSNLQDGKYGVNDVAEMGLNYLIAHEVYNSIVIGDTKFYKDAGTIIKRAKEELAGGTIYSSFDAKLDIFTNEELECKDILSEIGITNGPVIKERTGYKAITVYNTNRPSPKLDQIREDLRNEGFDENKINRLTKKFEGGKINDAQSYITFEEWIRRMYAIGELDQYKDLIQAIIDAKPDVNGKYNIDLTNINERIQVQKNYYFDLMYDEVTKCIYPRQIKNAEFVLVDKLLPKDSELKQIYDIMKANDISQINTEETSKAATRSVVTLWDNNGTYNPNWYNDAVKNSSTETFYYRSLYRQQEIPQHMVNTSNKFGIQVSKKPYDNVSTAGEVVKKAVEQNSAAYRKMIETTFEDFVYEMGWKIDKKSDTIVNKNGNPLTKKDYVKFLNQGKKEAQRLGLDSNFIEYWQTDENGETIMPNWFNNVSKKLQSVAQSMFNNNITRQKMPGFHAALVSDVGYGKKLEYRVISKGDNNNRLVYSEVRAPYWFKAHLKKQLEVETGTTIEEISDEELLKLLEQAGLDIHFWYFMPTEGKQSMAVVKIVEFLPEIYGSTAMAPEELVVEQGGKDFDSDTIYDICYNFDIATKEVNGEKIFDKFVKYNLEGSSLKDTDYMEAFKSHYNKLGKNIEEMSDKRRNIEYNKWLKKALQNKILTSMITILSDTSSTEENLMGSQFDDIKDASNKWDILRGQSVKHKPNIANIFDEIQYRDNAMSGAELKAMSVNRDTLCSLGNKSQAILSDGNEISILYDTNKYNKEKLIKRFGNATEVEINGNKYLKVNHNRFGWSTDNLNVDDLLITVYSSETTSHILDALKEGAIYNENKFTFRAFKTLVDIGSNYNTAIGLLSSPGLTAIVNAWNEKNSMFNEEFSVPMYAALKTLLNDNGIKTDKYANASDIKKAIIKNEKIMEHIISIIGEIKDADALFNTRMSLSADMFENRLKNDNLDKNYKLAFDILTIITFNNIDRIASKIENIAQCTNPDKFGAKTSIYETRVIINKINDNINNKDSILKVKYLDDKNQVIKDEDGNDIYVPFLMGLYGENSFFPHLKSIYENSTRSSVEINRNMFDMESVEMNTVTDELGVLLNKTLSVDEYNRFCRFIITRLNAYSQLLCSPITVNSNNKIVIDTERIDDIMKDEFNSPVEEEYLRVSGIVEKESIFNIEDINNPTEKEIIKFNRLTPGQKVIMINKLFKNNAELFDILNVELINDYSQKDKGYSINKITYTDGVYIQDDLINRFRNAFNNKNILIKLSAIDLIKYAFIVEGFNFKSGNITKIVPNDSMLSFSDDGINNIISELKDAMKIYYDSSFIPTTSLYDDYIRSHSEIIKAVKLKDDAKKQFNSSRIDNVDENENTASDGVRLLDGKDALKTALGFSDRTTPNYVRIKDIINDNKVRYTLYKIKIIKDNKSGISNIFMYPMNLLESNETSGISNNSKNNRFFKPKYYLDIIYDYLSEVPKIVTKEDRTNMTDAISKLRKENKIDANAYKEVLQLSTDANYIMKNTDSSNEMIKNTYTTFVRRINDALTDGKIGDNKYIFSYPAYSIKSKFAINVPIIQNIEINGKITPVIISRYKYFATNSNINRYYYLSINKKKGNDVSKVDYDKYEKIVSDNNPVEKSVIDNAINSLQFANDIFYMVRVMRNEETAKEEQKELDDAKKELNNIRNSSTIDVEDIKEDYYDATTSEAVARIIIDNIRRTNIESLDKAAIKFKAQMNKLGINEYSLSNINNKKSDIYKSAATYYKFLYDYIAGNLLHYKASDGVEYDLGEKDFYNHLVKEGTEKEVQEVIKILLEAKTFGSAINSIRNINLLGEDEETTMYINRIIKFINDINSMEQINKGIRNMFNIYYAKKYANNPLIKLGIINLNENFDDISILDKWFSDVTELPNKEIQVLTNIVEGIIGESQRLTAPDALKKFRDEWRAAGGTDNTNYSNFIDENGKFIQEFDNRFIEELNRLEEEVNEAILKGTSSEEYVYAKLRLDEFNAINRHQKAAQEFHLEDVRLRKEVLKNAKDIYLRYLELNEDLSSFDNSPLNNEETIIKKWEIKKKIDNLTSKYLEDGTEKIEYEADKAKALDKFIKESRENRKKYYKVSSIGDFDGYLKYHLSTIENIEKQHPRLTFNKLIAIPEYAESMQWLYENARKTVNKDISDELNKARKIYYGEDEKFDNSVLGKLKREKNRYDALGIIDGTKFTPEEIAAIKEDYQKLYGERQDKSLIKATNKENVVYTQEFYDLFTGKLTEEQVKEKHQLFAKANAILRKGLRDGKLEVSALFDPVYGITPEELKSLAQIYRQIRSIKSNKSDFEQGQFLKEFENHTNSEEYIIWKKYYNTYLVDRFDIVDFIDVVSNTYVKKDGTIIREASKPNTLLFGYSVPKNKEKYIDKERTDAKNTIAKYSNTVTTKYYEVEQRKHKKDTEWFDNNHIYNPYTGEYEPLPIWINRELKSEAYHYEPKNDFAYSEVIEGKEDKLYKKSGSYNYNSSTGNYNNAKYASLTDTEKKLSKLMQSTIGQYNFDNSVSNRIKEGFAPRAYKTPNNKTDIAKHTASQMLKILGLNWNVEPTSYDGDIDYSQHRELPFTMFNPLKLKETKDRLEQPIKTDEMTDAEYNDAIKEWKKKNKEIEDYNLGIEKAYLNKDYKKLMEAFIIKAVEYEARNKAKNTAFLLLEDLKNGKSIKTNNKGEVIFRRFKDISDNKEMLYEDNKNAVASIRNWINRVIYTQYREEHKGDAIWRFIQSQTTTKYMVANIRGGVANLSTGFANILGETFGNYYFSNANFRAGLHAYNHNAFSMIKDSYGLTATSFYSAVAKRFDIVEYDNALKQIQEGKNLDEVIGKFNDMLYICQTSGEHLMQNSVLFAMIDSYRICDIDGNGNYDAMSEEQYLQESEFNSLLKAIETYQNGKYSASYKQFIDSIKKDSNKKKAYDRFKQTINQGFLKSLNDKDFTKFYIKTREEEIKNAKERFSKFDTIKSQLELKDGLCMIKENSNFTNEMFGKFRREVQSVNNYIHGVYNKDGAAYIEKYAWGSLIMQYRKHIYPGIMKRYRGVIGRAMYNESRRAINKGSYVSLAQFIATEFTNLSINEKDKNTLGYIQAVLRAFIDTFLNLKLNFNTLDRWEQNNIRRALVDLGYSIGLMAATGMFYAMFDDDDEIKDSNFYSSILYLLDKCYTEVAMYTPRGLYTELQTAIKNPIAAWNGIEDTTKLAADIWDYIIGADKSLRYQSGQYKGELKPTVYLKKNIPLYRQINAYQHRAKNNNYYRIGDNNINLVIPKQIVYGKNN